MSEVTCEIGLAEYMFVSSDLREMFPSCDVRLVEGKGQGFIALTMDCACLSAFLVYLEGVTNEIGCRPGVSVTSCNRVGFIYVFVTLASKG